MSDDSNSISETTVALDGVDAAAKKAGRSIASALASGQSEARKFEGVLRQLEQRLASLAIESAATGLGGLLAQNISGGLSSVLTSAAASPAMDFVVGGAGGGMNSGQTTAMAAHGAQPVSVTMNISTPDAESFKRSEAQISAQLARMAQRGQRSL
jgi:hypothetical protein